MKSSGVPNLFLEQTQHFEIEVHAQNHPQIDINYTFIWAYLWPCSQPPTLKNVFIHGVYQAKALLVQGSVSISHFITLCTSFRHAINKTWS